MNWFVVFDHIFLYFFKISEFTISYIFAIYGFCIIRMILIALYIYQLQIAEIIFSCLACFISVQTKKRVI